eukprot:TRINITY_DN8593_c0_g2_i7.p1 TRINITY_DN8593_c0_g2~~TRINITY_DN8593_c0_g2_i7.p1  ORF type:complete len:401 (-),score=63.50 TRINITY_DN8593_c0_g2_i7:213-1334(-)
MCIRDRYMGNIFCLMEADSKVFTSFFEHSSGSFWDEEHVPPEEEVIYEGFLSTRTVLRMWKKNYYVLQMSSLVCFSDELKLKPKSFVRNFHLVSIRMKTSSDEDGPGFEVTKHGKTIFFSVKKANQFAEWEKAFRRVAIFQDFKTRFKILRTIVEGTFSRLCLIRDRGGKHLSVKIVDKAEVLSRKNGKEALQTEILLSKQIDHPNVVKTIEVMESERSIFFVMELAGEEDLWGFLEVFEDFGEKERKTIMKGLLSGLAYLHRRRIIYRDVKPTSILIGHQDGVIRSVKLWDFGLAVTEELNKVAYMRCGTPGFIAPEVFRTTRERGYTNAIDIYSCGIIFYILSANSLLKVRHCKRPLKQMKLEYSLPILPH